MVCPYIRHVNEWSEAANLTYKRKRKKRLDAEATYICLLPPFSFLSPRQLERAVLPAFHIGSAIMCVPQHCELYGILKVFLPTFRQTALSFPLNSSF
jgi:hypothetical protein